MKIFFKLIVSALLFGVLVAAGGFLLIQFRLVSVDSFVAVACIVVAVALLGVLLVVNAVVKKLSLPDLLPVAALVAVIVIFNLLFAHPFRQVSPSASANGSD